MIYDHNSFLPGGLGIGHADGPAASPASPSGDAAAAHPVKLRDCLDCGAQRVYPDGFATPRCCWACEWDREAEMAGPPMIGVLIVLLLAGYLTGAAVVWLAVSGG